MIIHHHAPDTYPAEVPDAWYGMAVQVSGFDCLTFVAPPARPYRETKSDLLRRLEQEYPEAKEYEVSRVPPPWPRCTVCRRPHPSDDRHPCE